MATIDQVVDETNLRFAETAAGAGERARNAARAVTTTLTMAHTADSDLKTAGITPTWSKGTVVGAANTAGSTWRSERWWGTAEMLSSTQQQLKYAQLSLLTRGDIIDVEFDWTGTGLTQTTTAQSTIWQLHGPIANAYGAFGTWPGPPLSLSVKGDGTFRLGGGSAVPKDTGATDAWDTTKATYAGPFAPANLGAYPSFVNGTTYRHRIRALLDGPGVGWVSWWINGTPIVSKMIMVAGTWYNPAGHSEFTHAYLGMKNGLYGSDSAAMGAGQTSTAKNFRLAHTVAATGETKVYASRSAQTFEDILASGTTGQVLTKTGEFSLGNQVGDVAWATGVAGKVDKGDICLSINDYENDPTNIASVLDQALADGAATRRVVHLGPGVWASAKAGRHQIKSYSGLVGDDSGATIIKFTNAVGGLHCEDTLGSSGQHIYQVKLSNLILDGNAVVPKIITGVRIEEFSLRQLRMQGWTDAGIELEQASLVNTYRLEGAGTDATLYLPLVRFLGTTGALEFASPNFYKCSGIELAGPSLSDVRFTGQPWVEACPDLFTINYPAGPVSIGRIEITGRVVSTLTACRIVRSVAAGSSTMAIAMIDVRGLNLAATSSTSPLIDFTAFANAGTAMVRLRESALVLPAFTGQLISVHASQLWYLMHVVVAELYGTIPGSYYSTARWLPTGGYNNGSAFSRPLALSGSGSPEGVQTATVGSTYQRIDSGQLSFYRKVSGSGATGWQPMDTFGPIKTVTASYTATYEDSVIIANGTGLTITLPSAGSYGGRRFTIKNVNASTATIGGTVDGAASPTLTQWQRMTVITDGTAWRRID